MKKHTKYLSLLIRQYVNIIDPTAEIILYGSRARGDERTDSDWDILVLTNYPIDVETERKFRNKLYDLELFSGESISFFLYSKNEWETKHRISPFYNNVTQEGIRL